jgi:putative serine/threonine protein kinase
MELYAKGKRSFIYKQNNIVIKTEHPDSKAVNRIENEAFWLKKLNKYKIGPKFIKLENKKLFMEFINGTRILDHKCIKKERIILLKDLLHQCRILDTLKVDKFEMHHPVKHALVRGKKIVLIDFERCKTSLRPKNVTQVCQFISRNYNLPEILDKAKKYKLTYSDKDYKEIEKCLINIS